MRAVGESVPSTHERRIHYRGPVRAIILDWAGTTVDYGSMAPVAAFQRIFADRGVAITALEARGPMGLGKRAHIEALTTNPKIARRWQTVYGRVCGPADVDEMYAAFEVAQVRVLPEFAELIPGVRDAVDTLRRRGVKIGTTTGYSAEMMATLQPLAARQGYEPDAVVSTTDVAAGRPAPFMCFKNMEVLGVWPAEACVKIDDTIPGIEEGLNAGMWTIGVTVSGNEMGLTRVEAATLEPAEREARYNAASVRLRDAGAHIVIDTVADVLSAADTINEWLSEGRRP